MSLKKGDKAPDFTLKNTDGEDVSLTSLTKKGNVVLLFFPLSFSSVCTAEMCTMRDNISDYNKLNAQVVGVSVDSFFTLKKFKEAENLNFPLLSDFNKTTSRDYNSLYDDFFGMRGVSKRAAFVIDKNGIIQYREILEKASDLPDFEAVKAALNGLG